MRILGNFRKSIVRSTSTGSVLLRVVQLLFCFLRLLKAVHSEIQAAPEVSGAIDQIGRELHLKIFSDWYNVSRGSTKPFPSKFSPNSVNMVSLGPVINPPKEKADVSKELSILEVRDS